MTKNLINIDDKTYTIRARGAGLIHVTGETQENFMKYLYATLPEGVERDVVKKYLDGYEEISENGITKMNNKYEIIEPYINEDGKSDIRHIYASEFIADNYSIESAVWFWGINRERVAIFNETDINPPAELGRLADASGDKQSTRIKPPLYNRCRSGKPHEIQRRYIHGQSKFIT